MNTLDSRAPVPGTFGTIYHFTTWFKLRSWANIHLNRMVGVISEVSIVNTETYIPDLRRWGITAISIFSLLSGLVGPTALYAQQPIRFAYPGYNAEIWTEITRKIENTHGALDYRMIPNDWLGGPNHVLNALHHDRVDVIAIDGIRFAREVELFEILNLPFIMHDVENAHRTIESIGDELQHAAQSVKLRVLGYTWFPGTFVSTGRCVDGLRDMKGSNVIVDLPSYQEYFNVLGATPIPVPGYDIPSALGYGYADKGLFLMDFIRNSELYRVTDCLTDPESNAPVLLPYIFVTSQHMWNQMDTSLRESMQEDFRQLEDDAEKIINKASMEVVRLFKESGKSNCVH